MISEVSSLLGLMAKAMTGTFTITSTVQLTNGGGTNNYETVTIPIGSLIDVGDAQALEIESVDYIYLNEVVASGLIEPLHASAPFNADSAFGCQLMDRNVGTWLDASDNNLISSSALWYDTDGKHGGGSDFFPDDFQKTNGRFVVNDEVYAVGFTTLAPVSGAILNISVRIRAKVVKLSTRDWMAISLETVQNE